MYSFDYIIYKTDIKNKGKLFIRIIRATICIYYSGCRILARYVKGEERVMLAPPTHLINKLFTVLYMIN